MSSQGSVEALIGFVKRNEALVEVFVFLLGFAESLVFVSFFIPASVLFLGIAALQGASDAPLLPIVLAGAAGALAGDIVSYALGWRVRHNLDKCWPFRSNPDMLARARSMFERRGIYAIVVGKFVGPLRPVVPFVGGAMQMPWAKFTTASAASSLAWSVIFLAPSYYGIKFVVPT
jgi:undecaprenyl-diphosphatase